ncbi:MAG: spore germination protein, partial [Oscillospiraceae bacterium]
EALIIHFVFEMMREAGLRLPRAVGHAVSIVGALVIGETAVAAGLIGTPMVLIVAVTAISSFVIPQIYDAVSILRISLIIIGGFFGILGITLTFAVIGVNMCSINPLGIPFTSPLSPFNIKSMRDVIYRSSWINMRKKAMKVQNLSGSEIKDDE